MSRGSQQRRSFSIHEHVGVSYLITGEYDWPVDASKRSLLKTRLVLVAFALVLAGLSLGLHRLIR